MDTFFNQNDKKATTKQVVVGLAVSAITIFAVVYLAGKAWKKSQTA